MAQVTNDTGIRTETQERLERGSGEHHDAGEDPRNEPAEEARAAAAAEAAAAKSGKQKKSRVA